MDRTKWSHWPLGPRDDGVNVPMAVSVSEGILTIKTYTWHHKNYTGMISTRGKFEPRYGYVEIRANLHTRSGQWSMFYMTCPTIGERIGDWAFSGTETDVIEHRASDYFGNDIAGEVQHALHWDGYGVHHRTIRDTAGDLGLRSGYHTYGLLWTPRQYDFFVDGRLTWTVPAPVSVRPEALVLGSDVWREWCGPIPSSGFGSLDDGTTRMAVDYVRFYQQPPDVSAPRHHAIQGNSVAASIPLHVSDSESSPWDIKLRAWSLNQGLIPNDGMTITKGTNPWTAEDIGAPGMAGKSDTCGMGLTVVGSGSGVSSNADAFHFRHQRLSGDGVIRARIERLDAASVRAQAGVMIREDTAPGSRCVFLSLTPGGGLSLHRRKNPGQPVAEVAQVPGVMPAQWLRLVRKGDTFTAYCRGAEGGADGKWARVGAPLVIPMAHEVRVGLAVAGGKRGLACNALYTRVEGTLKTGGERRLVVTPLRGRSGSAVIKLVADDGLLQKAVTFNLTVAALPYTNAAPLLAAALHGDSMTVDWPAGAQGYGLQCATSLLPPVVWTDVTNKVVVTNGVRTTAVSAQSPLTFYRLLKR